MTTYICKCGRTFQKNTEAGTTGFRMPDYGPEHECFGCPFVNTVAVRDPISNADSKVAECRGCKEIPFYDTTVTCVDSRASTLHVKSLDIDFIQTMTDFYNTLDGVDQMKSPPYAGMEEVHGRLPFSFYFPQNLKGEAAKQKLIERFFEPVDTGNEYNKMYGRKDVSGFAEKHIVYDKIEKVKEEAKAMAQGKQTDPAEAGTAYVHGNFRYFVDQREDNGKFTAFMSSPLLGEGARSEVPTIPDVNTFDEAQNALDGFALKKGYVAEGSTPEKNPKMEQSGDGPDDIGLDGMEELAEYQELTKPNGDEVPESGNDADQNDPSTDENSDSPEDSGDPVDDTPEEPQQPCDWQNASGDDEDRDNGDDGEPDEESAPEVSGDPLSLRGHEFDEIIHTANSVLNSLVAMLHAKKQRDGEMTIKVTFEDADGDGSYIFGGAVSGKINYTVKPQKVSSEPVELKFDGNGNPIVPSDRQHQLNFDELQPGRNIPPSGTAMVDGNTGIVEDYKEDGRDQAQEDDQGGEAGEKLYPCTNCDCPFFGVSDDGDDVCCFDRDADDTHQPDVVSDLDDAVKFENCTRPEVIEAYSAACPPEETDFEGTNDQDDDFPPFQDSESEEKAS